MSADPGSVTLVTGSARGLGLASARRLAERGHRVHVVYRNPSAHVAALEREFDGRVHRADLTRAEDWPELLDAVLARDSALDHFVHAVGEYVHGPIEAASDAQLRRMVESNLVSAFLGLGAARSALRARGGSAVFFGCAGLEGLRARRDTAIYSAVKSALLVLVRSWAVEEAPHGVRVNMVSPGHVPHEHASADTRDPALWQRIPIGRPGEAGEVADAVAWLLSTGSSYVTGIDLPVAGGWML